MKNIGKELDRIITEKGMVKKKLAENLGITPASRADTAKDRLDKHQRFDLDHTSRGLKESQDTSYHPSAARAPLRY